MASEYINKPKKKKKRAMQSVLSGVLKNRVINKIKIVIHPLINVLVDK